MVALASYSAEVARMALVAAGTVCEESRPVWRNCSACTAACSAEVLSACAVQSMRAGALVMSRNCVALQKRMPEAGPKPLQRNLVAAHSDTHWKVSPPLETSTMVEPGVEQRQPRMSGATSTLVAVALAHSAAVFWRARVAAVSDTVVLPTFETSRRPLVLPVESYTCE